MALEPASVRAARGGVCKRRRARHLAGRREVDLVGRLAKQRGMVRMGLAEPALCGSFWVLKPALSTLCLFNLRITPEGSVFLRPFRVTLILHLYGICMVHGIIERQAFDPGEFCRNRAMKREVAPRLTKPPKGSEQNQTGWLFVVC